MNSRWKAVSESLKKFKGDQLRNLNINIATTGTKPHLIRNITATLSKPSPLSAAKPLNGESFVILAIDMGVKNFGFCRLQLNKNLPFNKPPIIKEWDKLDLTKYIDKDVDLTRFEPHSYAQLCEKLISQTLLNSNQPRPDIILIERQRTRSMSSKNILEWVLRVNMFESMLFGMIYSKFLEKTPELASNVLSVSPQRMGLYYKPNKEEDKKLKKDVNPKNERIQLVERWLQQSQSSKHEPKFILDPARFPLIPPSPHITSKTRYLTDLILGPGSEFKSGRAKADDLVDSLLHALSWVEWERNRMILKMELNHDVQEAVVVSEGLLERHWKEVKGTK